MLLWSQAAGSEKASSFGLPHQAAPPGTKAALIPSTLVSDPYLEFGVFIFYIHLSSAWGLFSNLLPSSRLPVTPKFVFLARRAAKFQSSKWPEWKPLNSHRFNHCGKLEPFVVRFWWRSIKISPMPPFTFFLSGLVKVSEKGRIHAKVHGAGGRDLNDFFWLLGASAITWVFSIVARSKLRWQPATLLLISVGQSRAMFCVVSFQRMFGTLLENIAFCDFCHL